jgi:hypothetical protein
LIKSTDLNYLLPKKTPEKIRRAINEALINSANGEAKKMAVRTVKQHPSGDIVLYAEDKNDAKRLVKHQREWIFKISNKARTHRRTDGVVVHGVRTSISIRAEEIQKKLRFENTHLREAEVSYAGWLRRDISGKTKSSLIIEFGRSEHADIAIKNSVCFGAELLTYKYYHREGRLTRCYNC